MGRVRDAEDARPVGEHGELARREPEVDDAERSEVRRPGIEARDEDDGAPTRVAVDGPTSGCRSGPVLPLTASAADGRIDRYGVKVYDVPATAEPAWLHDAWTPTSPSWRSIPRVARDAAGRRRDDRRRDLVRGLVEDDLERLELRRRWPRARRCCTRPRTGGSAPCRSSAYVI